MRRSYGTKLKQNQTITERWKLCRNVPRWPTPRARSLNSRELPYRLNWSISTQQPWKLISWLVFSWHGKYTKRLTSSIYLVRLACSFQLSFLQVCGVGLDPDLVPVPRRALRVNWPLTLLVLDESAVKISENISSITTKPMSGEDEEKPRGKKSYMWHLLNGPRYI